MKRTVRNNFILILAVWGLFLMPASTDARRWNISINTNKVTPRIMQKFITKSGNASEARSDGTNFQQNDKIHFYYKIGPLGSVSGKGAPFNTKLVIKQGSRTLKDFGWQSANAANAAQMGKNFTMTWYHSAAWNITLSPSITPGRYTAIVSHQDINSGKNLDARYNFTVKASSTSAATNNNIETELKTFAEYFKAKRLDRVMSYVGTRTEIMYCNMYNYNKSEVENFLKYSFLSNSRKYIKYEINLNSGNPRIIFFRPETTEGENFPVEVNFKIENNRLIIKKMFSNCLG